MAEKKTKPLVKKATTKKATPVKKAAKPAPEKASAKKVQTTEEKKPAEKKGKLAVIKTKETTASVVDFINNVKDEQQRKDSFTILEMMKKATGEEPKMWGTSLVGFGNVRYKSPNTGREVDWLRIGFAPRKANISLYLTMNINAYGETLKKLGKHKTGVGCLYINKLADIDTKVLKGLIDISLKKSKML
ncbi:MAG TPA: DUF1801 domain-containing protein [Flavipsychrobacter sp.]|nr:DUF1801 domain-containing protein [Flavipsychrobacter sp.]